MVKGGVNYMAGTLNQAKARARKKKAGYTQYRTDRMNKAQAGDTENLGKDLNDVKPDVRRMMVVVSEGKNTTESVPAEGGMRGKAGMTEQGEARKGRMKGGSGGRRPPWYVRWKAEGLKWG